ncbi:hypothetical protein AURDEDRAFT_175739 [Auricularia subglabra TFB-10046 SS5]|uniref:Uncharacterized protein n=1 Tax=Auricularia subglabra (strain TFB-10046 / SS5) TaxID=717982 RepID=J0WRC1_AURST|nr:hypothetical protein AURDEDRAFT_175739 [Auricularia subglabra TFB-10046 SS5]
MIDPRVASGAAGEEEGEDEGAARAMRILNVGALDDGPILHDGADLHHCGPSISRAPPRAHHVALLLAAAVQLEDWRTSGRRRRVALAGAGSYPGGAELKRTTRDACARTPRAQGAR